MTTVFVELPNTKIELLQALGVNSPIQRFVEKNPNGGIHHLCYEVEDIDAAITRLKTQGATVLGDGAPKPVLTESPLFSFTRKTSAAHWWNWNRYKR